MPFHAINFRRWIDEHRHLLKPPVGNQTVYTGTENFIVMVVGGPNARSDYHYNETEEFFYQIEGDIVLKLIEDGKPVEVPLREGDIFLLPPKIPHSPQRPAGTVGLVMEVKRSPGMKDGIIWFCDHCQAKVYEEVFEMTDIVGQLKGIMERFYASEKLRTCKACGRVQPIPGR
ncbi:MAG: 3-hydroxyanthranilate 3,4-dioxygenase [Calditrichaeota bacterium]|nr:3-hydroxyanthranilate 3,4-dioxygenase [Calditrichota bacterium]